MRMMARMRLAALFVGCFLVSTYGLGIAGRLYLPPPEVGELTDKIAGLAQESEIGRASCRERVFNWV